METVRGLYKIISLEQWELSKGQDKLSSSKADQDFIHLCEGHQIEGVIKRHYAGHTALIIAQIDGEKLPGRLLHEFVNGVGEHFFHLYDGYIPMNAIIKTEKIELGC